LVDQSVAFQRLFQRKRIDHGEEEKEGNRIKVNGTKEEACLGHKEEDCEEGQSQGSKEEGREAGSRRGIRETNSRSAADAASGGQLRVVRIAHA
jgi:hypothetical protein